MRKPVIRALRHLLSPDSFEGDWYGWLTNQLSHALFGIMAALILCATYYMMMGEYPYRLHVWIIITIAYAARETWSRKLWRDSLEDTLFVCFYGAGSVLYSTHEIKAGYSMVSIAPLCLLAPCLVMAMHCAIGCLSRMARHGPDPEGMS